MSQTFISWIAVTCAADGSCTTNLFVRQRERSHVSDEMNEKKARKRVGRKKQQTHTLLSRSLMGGQAKKITRRVGKGSCVFGWMSVCTCKTNELCGIHSRTWRRICCSGRIRVRMRVHALEKRANECRIARWLFFTLFFRAKTCSNKLKSFFFARCLPIC